MLNIISIQFYKKRGNFRCRVEMYWVNLIFSKVRGSEEMWGLRKMKFSIYNKQPIDFTAKNKMAYPEKPYKTSPRQLITFTKPYY